MKLTAEYFFDLTLCPFSSLFKKETYVWEALNELQSYFQDIELGKIEIEIQEGIFLVNPELISIGRGTVVEPGVYIKGPCVIGENCQIRQGAYLRGNVLTGNQCVIGHDTEVKNSILLNRAQAAHFAYLGDSILGNQVNLGAGTKCANLRLDHGLIQVHYQGEKINTGLKKFGAIIGDKSQLGCNSVSNPGTLMGKGALCYPCTNFGGWIPDNHVVKSSASVVVSPL